MLKQRDERTKAAVFYYIIRPMMNRFVSERIVKCPMCGEMLQYYDEQGFLHLADGDADCYGVLGAGKGSFK
jgi:transcription initiation factor IIE alpha subunit